MGTSTLDLDLFHFVYFGGNEYLVQQLLDRLLDAGFTTAQVKMDKTQNRLKALNMFLFIQSSTPTSTAIFVNFQECL